MNLWLAGLAASVIVVEIFLIVRGLMALRAPAVGCTPPKTEVVVGKTVHALMPDGIVRLDGISGRSVKRP